MSLATLRLVSAPSISETVAGPTKPGDVGATSGHVLSLVARRHFSPFKTVIRRDAGLALLLNPKAATTWIRQVLLDTLQEAGEPPQLGPLWPFTLTRRYLTAPPADLLHFLWNPGHYSLCCFVRNPYARVLSAWRDKFAFRHTGGYSRSTVRLVPRLRRLAREQGLPGQGADEPIPFATFLAFIESQPEGTRDHHWDTQRSILFTNLLRYSRIYQIETQLVCGMREIFSQLGLPLEGLAAKLRQPLNASRPLAEPVYTEALAQRVYALYAGDFNEFGYDADSWHGM